MSSTLLDMPAETTTTPAVNRLRTMTAAIRLAFVWFGVRKSLTQDQKSQAADTFGAEGAFLSAGKKLIDTRHPAFKAVTAIRGKIIAYFRSMSLPYPEPGVRLIRQADIAAFNVQMTSFKAELDESVEQLDRHYDELRQAARQRLGRLYNPLDYPSTLRELFQVAWDFPSVEAPPYLEQLSPQLYQQECQRVAARFDEAIALAEQAFTEELSRLVSHLTERLSGDEDGKSKVFRDSAIENLHEFFDRFRHLNVRSNEQLDDLVGQAQRVVRGVEPQTLRDNAGVRQQIATQLSSVGAVLDGLLVDRPRRNILRRSK